MIYKFLVIYFLLLIPFISAALSTSAPASSHQEAIQKNTSKSKSRIRQITVFGSPQCEMTEEEAEKEWKRIIETYDQDTFNEFLDDDTQVIMSKFAKFVKLEEDETEKFTVILEML